MCQRYYYQVDTTVEGGGLCQSEAALDSMMGVHENYPVTMRATPTLTMQGTTSRTGANLDAQRVSKTHFVFGRRMTGGGSPTTAGAYATGGFNVDAEL